MFKLVMAMLCFVMALAACVAIVAEADDAPAGGCWVCAIRPPASNDSLKNPHDDDPAIEPPAESDVIPEDTRREPLFNARDCDQVHDVLLHCNHLET
jgi:hypothetical protein